MDVRVFWFVRDLNLSMSYFEIDNKIGRVQAQNGTTSYYQQFVHFPRKTLPKIQLSSGVTNISASSQMNIRSTWL